MGTSRYELSLSLPTHLLKMSPARPIESAIRYFRSTVVQHSDTILGKRHL